MIEFFLSIGRESLIIVLLLTGPVLIAGLVVGLLVSIFQTATSIQEQSLVFVPKIIVVIAVLFLLGPWMLNILVNFTQRLFKSLPLFIR